MGESEKPENNDLDILLISPLEGGFFPKEVTSIESVIRLAAPEDANVRVFNQDNLGDLEVNQDKIRESHIVISGSDKSVHEAIPYKEKIADVIRFSRDHGKRLLGICWGHQFIAERLGGEVFVAQEYPDVPVHPEFGVGSLRLTSQGMEDPIFHRLRAKDQEEEISIFEPVFYMTHMDHVKGLPHKPQHVEVLAESEPFPNQVLRIDDHIITTQMHPELIKIQVMHFITLARKELVRILGKERYKSELPGWEEKAKNSVQKHYRQAEKNGLQFMRNFYHRPRVLARQMMLDFFDEMEDDENRFDTDAHQSLSDRGMGGLPKLKDDDEG